MALSVASSRSSAVRGAVRSQQQVPRPRRTLVVRAGFGNALSGIASAFTTIFSPPQHTNVPWDGTGSSFSGRISHKAGKPFADGFGASSGERRAMNGAEQQDANMAAAAAPGVDEDVTDYVSSAVKRIVGHNFTGDATEPEWGGVGWKGEIHHKNRDGFHTDKRH